MGFVMPDQAQASEGGDGVALARDPIRRALVATFRRIIRLYFREIGCLGEAPGPETQGRLVVSNHMNALIDPMLVITGARCELAPVAKSTLWNIPGLRWVLDRAGAVAIVRRQDSPDKDASANTDAFTAVATHLRAGGNILIFPEGTSHNEPQLAPLRTGAARMLLEAEATRGVPPTFQAAALEFDHRSGFRSRTLVLWGPVRRFADVAGTPEERIQTATAIMDADLRELLVEGPTHEEKRRVVRIAELLAGEATGASGGTTLAAWSVIGRRVEGDSQTLSARDPALVARIASAIDAYFGALGRRRLEDAHVIAALRDSHGPAAATAGTHLLSLLRSPLAAAGLALYAIPYLVPRRLARTVDAHKVSTLKLGSAFIVYPLWAAGLVGCAFRLLPTRVAIAAAALAVTSPFAALRWLDGWHQRARRIAPADLARLARLRTAARAAIDDARARLPS